MSVVSEFRQPRTFDELLLALRVFLLDNGVDVEMERLRNGGGGYRLILEMTSGHAAYIDIHQDTPKAG